MKIVFCLFFCLLNIAVGYSQSIEYLKKELLNKPSNKQKTEILRKIACHFYEKNSDSVAFYAKLSLEHGEKVKSIDAKGNGHHQMGVAYRLKNNIDSAIYHFEHALELRLKQDKPERIASTIMDLGILLYGQGVRWEDLAYNQDSDELFERDFRIATVFFQKAKDKFRDALIFVKKSNDSTVISLIYQNMGSVEYRLSNYDKAILTYDKSYSWQPDSSKKDVNARLILAKVACLQELNPETELKGILTDLRKDFQSNGQTELWIMTNLNLAIQKTVEDKDLAIELLKEADSLSIVEKSLIHRIRINGLLYDIYKELGDANTALKYHEIYARLTNDVMNSETQGKISELNVKYETERRKTELLESKKLSAERKSRIYQLVSILIGATILVIVLAFLFIQRQRSNRLKRDREKQSHDEAVNTLIQNQELESIQAMLEGQEVERQRIAEDLHDRLGSTLSAARMYVEVSLADQPSTDVSSKTFKLIDQAIEDTREIANDLISGTLSKFGLIAALRGLKNTIEGTGQIKVSMELNVEQERFHPDVEINLYRVIQEVFSNSLKHANASELNATINQRDDELIVKISDNGRGFVHSEIEEGMGLSNIKARIKKLDGELTCSSIIDKGTQYGITIKSTPHED